jgi:hypothetical protein
MFINALENISPHVIKSLMQACCQPMCTYSGFNIHISWAHGSTVHLLLALQKKLCVTHHIQYQFFRICISWFSTKRLDYLSIKMIFSFDAESELSPIQSCFELTILIILVSTYWVSEVGELNNVWFKFHAFNATHCLSFCIYI